MKLLADARKRSRGSITQAKKDGEIWVSLRKEVEKIVRTMPLWKLQTLGKQEVPFLYERNSRGRTIELKPGETEIIGSNLDSKETAELFALAKTAFEREVKASPQLRQRARTAAERAITGLLNGLGFAEVRFVEALPGEGPLT